jgi:hypothetical protein
MLYKPILPTAAITAGSFRVLGNKGLPITAAYILSRSYATAPADGGARAKATTDESGTVTYKATGEKITQAKLDDEARAQSALETKNQEIREHAKAMSPSDPHQIYGVPSVDFGKDYNLPHPIWQNEYIWRIEKTHLAPNGVLDKLAHLVVSAMKFNFDWMSGWMFGQKTRAKALNRIVFLETVAGVPGSIAGILRHLASLRRMRRDHGWIHTLFEEAENERMHLLTYLELKKPSPFFRGVVFITQGIFYNFFWVAYMLSPRFCHRLVGYIEEQAVHTYTTILKEIDDGKSDLAKWRSTPAPEIAKAYWKMAENATMRDVIAVTRADEAHHRDVNHSFASMQSTDPNPFKPGF